MNLGALPLVVSLLTAQAPSPAKPATPPSAARAEAPSQVPGIAPLPGPPNLWASVPPELRQRVDPYLKARSANLADVSGDGKQVLIATRFADTHQLHVVEV